MGGRLSGGIVAGQTGKFQPCIHLNLRFPKRVSARNMSGYLRWSKEGRCMKILYFKVRLSTRTALIMDRCHNFALVSTEMPLFMDITAKPSVLSTKSCGSMDTTPFSSSLLAFS